MTIEGTGNQLPESRRQKWMIRILVLLGYAALTVLFTRPLAWRAGEGYVADLVSNGDGSYHFNPWQLSKCLEEGTSCSRTDYQCYPVGNSLALNTNMPLPSFMAQAWSDTTTGFNIVLLLNCFLMAWGGYLFARLFLRSHWLAFIAGALFAFWMGRSAHLFHGHANLMMAAPLPFALYALHRALPNLLRREHYLRIRWGWIFLFVLLAGITALHDLILCGFLFIFSFLVIVLLVYRRFIHPLRWYWQLLIIGGYIVLVDQGTQHLVRAKVNNNGAFYFSGSVRNLVYPHPVSAIYNKLLFSHPEKMIARPGFDPGRVMFPGFVFLALTLFLLCFRLLRKKGLQLPWLLALCCFSLLYTMPLLRWTNGRLLYGPFSWTHFIPFWNENRCPTRFMDVLTLLGSVWVFANLETLSIWERMKPLTRSVVAVLLTVALLAEHLPRSFFFVDLRHGPAVYQRLAESPDPVVMFVPFGVVDGKKAFGQMWLEPYAYQPVHGRKMVNGYLSRIDDDTWKFFEQDTFLTRMVRVSFLRPDTSITTHVLGADVPAKLQPPDSVDMLASLRRLQLHQIVIRPGMDHEYVYLYLMQAIRPFIISDKKFPEGHRLIQLRLPPP